MPRENFLPKVEDVGTTSEAADTIKQHIKDKGSDVMHSFSLTPGGQMPRIFYAIVLAWKLVLGSAQARTPHIHLG